MNKKNIRSGFKLTIILLWIRFPDCEAVQPRNSICLYNQGTGRNYGKAHPEKGTCDVYKAEIGHNILK